MVHCSRIKYPIGQLWTVTNFSTRKFVINRHACHICIYLLVTIIFPLSQARLPFSLKNNCFFRFLLSFDGFGNVVIWWYSYPHLNCFKGVRSVHLLSEWPAVQDFYFSYLILLKHFSAEWLVPPPKVHFLWTVFDL